MSISNPLFIAPDDPHPVTLPERPARKAAVNRPPRRARRALAMSVQSLAGRALDTELDRDERTSVWKELRAKCRELAPLLVENEERERLERIAFHGQPAINELPDLLTARLRTKP